MPHHISQSVIGLLLFWPAWFAEGSELFTVTDRHATAFVVESVEQSTTFVVTDRVTPPIKPTITPRPIVLLYSARWCAPCRVARQELDRAQLPFEVRIVDVTEGGQPAYVDSIPYFEWRSPRGRWFAKWSSVEDLVKRWELTQ